MYHSRWRGSHYEAGLHYGNILHKNGVNPTSSIPISDERKEFSVKCLPIYEKFYPEIVEEIKGMANGLKIGYMDIASFILLCIALCSIINALVWLFQTKKRRFLLEIVILL